jgi:hypothetical protein
MHIVVGTEFLVPAKLFKCSSSDFFNKRGPCLRTTEKFKDLLEF